MCSNLISGDPKILIVDESLQDLRIHASTLRNQGYEVFCARGEDDALMILESMIPDLFLIDTGMRDLNGYELCRRLKQNSDLRTIPVIFITGNRSPENIDQGYASGGVDYIVKPCHLSEFLSRVRTQIKLFQLVRQLLAGELVDPVPVEVHLATVGFVEPSGVATAEFGNGQASRHWRGNLIPLPGLSPGAGPS